MKYNFEEIEKKWQTYWKNKNSSTANLNTDQKTYYCLKMFPYLSGKIHMGHVRNYSIGNVISRFKKMQGYEVIHHMGWNTLSLPAKNATIKNKMLNLVVK
jgi:leucyl-tRNA synthetase